MTKTKRILQTYQAFLYLSYGSLRSRKEDDLEMKGPMAKLFLYRKRIDTIFIYKAFLKIRNVKSRLSSSPNLSTELFRVERRGCERSEHPSSFSELSEEKRSVTSILNGYLAFGY